MYIVYAFLKYLIIYYILHVCTYIDIKMYNIFNLRFYKPIIEKLCTQLATYIM